MLGALLRPRVVDDPRTSRGKKSRARKMDREAGVGWSGRIHGRGAGPWGVAAAFIAGVLVSVGFLGGGGAASAVDLNRDQPRVGAETQAILPSHGVTSAGTTLDSSAIGRPSATCAVAGTSTSRHRNVGDYGAP